MGGMFGEVRGATKIATYLNYDKQRKDWTEGTWLPEPTHKKACYREMERDRENGEWVLRFHFHT